MWSLQTGKTGRSVSPDQCRANRQSKTQAKSVNSLLRLCRQRTGRVWEWRVRGRVPNQTPWPKDERRVPVPNACWRTARVRVLLEHRPGLLRGNLMEQQLRRCYFSFISLRGGLLISGSKQKKTNTGSPFQRVPLSSTAAPSNAIANFSNSIVDPENRSANLIEAAPSPRSEAPAGPGTRGRPRKREHRMPRTRNHTRAQEGTLI